MLPKPRLPLFAAAVLAANLTHAAPTASAPFTPEQQQLIRQISASEANGLLPQVASAAAANVAKTIEGEKQAIAVAKDALEVGRKSVDWWLSNISFWVGGLGLLIAVAGIGIPLWMGRKQKAEWQEKLADITEKLKQAEAAQPQAEKHASEIEKLRDSAREKTSLIPNAEQLTGKLSDEVLEKLRAEKPPQVVKLIQQAWDAHEKEDWAAAKPLWSLLSLIESQDANVWFNLAVAEQLSGKNRQLICEAYQFSHLLRPSAIACHNWGIALAEWANTLTGDAQQQRFAAADQRYAEATRLMPDYSAAYYDWGSVLSHWAQTLPSDERAAKLDEAEHVLLLAKEKGSKKLYNFACLRTLQQRPDEARTLLQETRAAGFLPDHAHLSSDKDLDNLRELDWFKALLAEVKQEEERQAEAV